VSKLFADTMRWHTLAGLYAQSEPVYRVAPDDVTATKYFVWTLDHIAELGQEGATEWQLEVEYHVPQGQALKNDATDALALLWATANRVAERSFTLAANPIHAGYTLASPVTFYVDQTLDSFGLEWENGELVYRWTYTLREYR